MSAVVDIYTYAVYENLRPLFANWEPGSPVALGDYEIVVGRNFIPLGNVSQLGIKIEAPRELPAGSQQLRYFGTRGTTDVDLQAAVSGPTGLIAQAKLAVTFSAEDAVFFRAAGCRTKMVANKSALGREVMRRYGAARPSWRWEWAVVTDLITAAATTIAVSGGSSGSIVFEAAGNVPNVDLADASIGLNVRSEAGIVLSLFVTGGNTG
jgi:hypothetical protein